MYLLALATLLALPTVAVAQAADSLAWMPYQLRVGDQAHEFPITWVRVPENHAEPDGPSLELAIVRMQATTVNPGPPIIELPIGRFGVQWLLLRDLGLLRGRCPLAMTRRRPPRNDTAGAPSQ